MHIHPMVAIVGEADEMTIAVSNALRELGTRQLLVLPRANGQELGLAEDVEYTRAVAAGGFELQRAVRHADAVLLNVDLDGEAATALIDGVRGGWNGRLVYRSCFGAQISSSWRRAVRAYEVEEALRSNGQAFTIVRTGILHEWLLRLVTGNRLTIPAGEGMFAPAGLQQTAMTIAAVLTEEGYTHQTFELSGLEITNMRDVTAQISAALEIPIGYESRERSDTDTPYPAIIPDPEGMAHAIANGELAEPGWAISSLTQTTTLTFAQWLADNREALQRQVQNG